MNLPGIGHTVSHFELLERLGSGGTAVVYKALDVAPRPSSGWPPSEAEPYLRRAHGIKERLLGADHLEVSGNLSNLSQLCRATGRLAEAEPLARRALDLARRSSGQHLRVAMYLNGLPLAREALEIFAGVLGADHPVTQSARRDLENLTAA